MEVKPRLDSEISMKEKFNALSPKGKRQYIWEYYRVHIIITILCIIGLASFIHTMATKKDTYCNITYYNSYMNQEELYGLRDSLNNMLIEDQDKSTILLNPIWSDADSNYNLSPAEEIAIKIAAKEIDIAIVNKEYFDAQVSQDMFEDLSSLDGFLDLNIPEDSLVKSIGPNGNESIYGIKAENLSFLDNINFTTDNNIITIIINSERKENAMEILKVFTQ